MNNLSLDIVTPAMLAGLLVLLSHVPLGRQVLRRGIIFIDLAVAQAAATGALVASEWWHIEGGIGLQIAAAITALLVASGLHELEKRWPTVQEPLIGCTFVVMASLGMILVATDPHGGEHFTSLLSGEILWTDHATLWVLAGAASVSLLCLGLFRHPLLGFYLPFAVAITASVQAVGVYLVFASLILPSIAVRSMPGLPGILLGMATGVTGYLLGISASLLWDLPTGPAIVMALAVSALAFALLHQLALRGRPGKPQEANA
ncbi:MAG: metal ABC transporter permease [Alcanivorax sp.]|nr:metal ABC transporter permease [Alcanivorax sp.]